MENTTEQTSHLNVLGAPLEVCCLHPLTGYYRTGSCESDLSDLGVHSVCVEVTAEFLRFSAERGNDLSTPIPEMDFSGLRPGDRWCLCAARWQEAMEAGMAPRVVLRATHQRTLQIVQLEDLKKYALDLS